MWLVKPKLLPRSRWIMDAHITVTRERQTVPTAGAGILLYMARRVNNTVEISFVLAQEDFVEGWNQSGCWSAFEGGTRGSESCIDTAVREFSEETLGSVPIHGTSDPSAISRHLESGDYAMRICVERRDTASTHRAHVTYAVRIPWGTPVQQMFDSVHGPIRDLHERCTAATNADARWRAAGCPEAMRPLRDARIRAVNAVYDSLPQDLKSHPAVVHTPHAPLCVAVRPEYVEKRRIAVVPYHTLASMLRAHTRYSRGHGRPCPLQIRLRYSFVPVLKTIMGEIHGVVSRPAFRAHHAPTSRQRTSTFRPPPPSVTSSAMRVSIDPLSDFPRTRTSMSR